MTPQDHSTNELLDRARGLLLGQFIGDSLGSLVEFCDPEDIAARYPQGVRDLADGGTWNLLAGQPTDDSQMAMELILSLLEHGHYDADAVRAGYRRWAASDPFDIGFTVSHALGGEPNEYSQSNGALMRISPVAIIHAAASRPLAAAQKDARADATITHLNPIAIDANAAYVTGLLTALRGGAIADILAAMQDAATTPEVREAITSAPQTYAKHAGWVLLSLSLATHALRESATVGAEQALIDVVSFGGDTDTHAAIAGALLGATYGLGTWPERWVGTVLACTPDADRSAPGRALHSRYYAHHLLEQAEQLLALG
ncbi:hypothetical protein C1Y63_03170 [Corynebacterium sp. 13CS0277]|uniref:ADP-ribosylglycohydrolase family protein n=1 Tax=Corynebacterium sp. 13CS0277 TaxID=2071994 RepID=UPI000D033D6A|nr:ADP-ribosylglycohydrolase family protein [Corynebacterium sp. 13CS0277]PRQ12082.1 hypothetical protein C1Y63_03170 [Corynebacterium sp. 13CS0277]